MNPISQLQPPPSGFKLTLYDLLKLRLISIDPQRTYAFWQRNQHIRKTKQPLGTREEDLSDDEISIFATDDLAKISQKAGRGNIGNAHSIYHELRECIEDGRPRIILEDDTQLHPDINKFVVETWPAIRSLDLLILGGNTDSVITFEAMHGMPLSSCFLNEEDKHPTYERITTMLAKTPISKTSIYKLHHIFGSHAWIVSPKGAKKLINYCFPLNVELIDIPLLPRKLLGISFDIRWNSALKHMDAGICIPFLAMTPNNSKSRRSEKLNLRALQNE